MGNTLFPIEVPGGRVAIGPKLALGTGNPARPSRSAASPSWPIQRETMTVYGVPSMAATTTITIDAALKVRLAELARHAGTSTR